MLYDKLQNSKGLISMISCRVKTTKNLCVTINSESLVLGEIPVNPFWIPVIIGHSLTNNTQENVFYDNGKWIIYSDISQEVTIRFYKYVK